MPERWRDSIAEAVAVIELLDGRLEPIDQSLLEVARADARARLLRTIPGVGWLLGLTFAVEIGDVSRFPSASKLVATPASFPGSTSPVSAREPVGSREPGRRCCAGPRSRPPSTPGARKIHGTGSMSTSAPGRAMATRRAAVARKVLIAVWRVWSRQQPFKPAAAYAAAPPAPASSSQPLAA